MRRSRPDLVARNKARANPDLPYRKWPVEHRTWRNIISRCHREQDKDYPRYGGRGITVCERWRESFEAFLSDMGPRPSDRHSIDRLDNNGPYAPDNCAWNLMREQSRNRRNSTLITFNGETKNIVDWAASAGLCRVLIKHRLRAGWSVQDALTRPADRSANGRWTPARKRRAK